MSTTAIVRFRWRSGVLLAFTSAVGIFGFTWPLFTHASGSENLAHATDAPWLFVLVLPLLLAVLLAELADGGLDAKAVAVLGVLVACGAALRAPVTGVTGFSGIFFLLLPGGRVFGRGFGFVQGALTMFASALLTGGVGPWLPYEMLGCAWVGFGAGCLPRATGRVELALLAVYGAVSGYAFGFLLNLSFWPFSLDPSSSIAYLPGASFAEQWHRYLVFDATTSLGWDTGRAVTNFVLVLVVGPAALATFRRAARRAAFEAPVLFHPPAQVAATDRSVEEN